MIKKYKEIKKNKSQLMWFILKYASIAQLVECSLGKAEVTGSIPVGSSINYRIIYKKVKKYCKIKK